MTQILSFWVIGVPSRPHFKSRHETRWREKFPPTFLLRLSLIVAIIPSISVDCDGSLLLSSLGIHDFGRISVLLRPLLSSEYPKYLRYLEEGNSERFLSLVAWLLTMSISWLFLELYKYAHYYLTKTLEVLEFSPFQELSKSVSFFANYVFHFAGFPANSTFPTNSEVSSLLASLHSHWSETPSIFQWLLEAIIQITAGMANLPLETSFYPLEQRRRILRQLQNSPAGDPRLLDACLSSLYCGEKTRHALLCGNEAPAGQEIDWMKLPESWLLLELVYDENQGFFGAARWDRNLPAGIFVSFPSEQLNGMKRLLAEFAGIMTENEGSFVVDEAFRHDRRYIQSWWQRRKSVDFRLRQWQSDLECHFLRPFLFLFQRWQRGNALDSVIEEIVGISGDGPKSELLRLFLHCNAHIRSLSEFNEIAPILGVAKMPEMAAPLFQKYGDLLSIVPSKSILLLSPSLQLLPIENTPIFARNAITITRHFCLSSVSDACCDLPTSRVISRGSYVINISFSLPQSLLHKTPKETWRKPKRN